MLRAKPVAWEDPEKSIGRKSTVIKGKTVWEATGPAADIFENKLFGIIDQLLKAHKEELESDEKISRTVSFHLWMVGREPRSARPTIIFTCKSPGYRAKVVRILERNNVLGDFPGMALKTMEKCPRSQWAGTKMSFCLALKEIHTAWRRESSTSEKEVELFAVALSV
jgi:hypothetical protein